jgi:hypothetical protein
MSQEVDFVSAFKAMSKTMARIESELTGLKDLKSEVSSLRAEVNLLKSQPVTATNASLSTLTAQPSMMSQMMSFGESVIKQSQGNTLSKDEYMSMFMLSMFLPLLSQNRIPLPKLNSSSGFSL